MGDRHEHDLGFSQASREVYGSKRSEAGAKQARQATEPSRCPSKEDSREVYRPSLERSADPKAVLRPEKHKPKPVGKPAVEAQAKQSPARGTL